MDSVIQGSKVTTQLFSLYQPFPGTHWLVVGKRILHTECFRGAKIVKRNPYDPEWRPQYLLFRLHQNFSSNPSLSGIMHCPWSTLKVWGVVTPTFILFLFLCRCVYDACTLLGTYMSMYAHGGVRRGHQGCCSITLCHVTSRWSLSLKLELSWWPANSSNPSISVHQQC